MTRIRNYALVGVFGALLAGGSAFAQGQAPNPDGWRRGPGPGFGRGMFGRDAGLPLRMLNLTDAQREQIRSLREAYQAQVQPLQERLRSDIENVLTPEQRDLVTKLRAEREGRRQQMQQRRQQRQQ